MDWYNFQLRRRAVLHWFSELRPKVNIPIGFWFLLVQILGCASVIYGVWLYSHPVAFIGAGILAVVTIEMQHRQEKKLSPEQVAYFQSKLKQALAAGEDPFGDPYNVPLSADWIAYAVALRRKA